jgi:hypothetical protein
MKENEISFYKNPRTGVRRLAGKGEQWPDIEVDRNGKIKTVAQCFKNATEKVPKLDQSILRANMSKAIKIMRPELSNLDIRLIQQPATQIYATEWSVKTDPLSLYEIVPHYKGIPYGPGSMGRGTIANDSGEINMINLGYTFNTVDESQIVYNEDQARDMAAAAVLRLREVPQTTCRDSLGQIITGVPYIGGNFFKSSPRIKEIIQKNLGVRAYHFIFSDGNFLPDGKPTYGYEVVIDAKSGDPLVVSGAGFLGMSPGKSDPKSPSSSKMAKLIVGKKIFTFKNVQFKRETSIPKLASQEGILKTDRQYNLVKVIGKDLVQIDKDWYRISPSPK